MDMTFPARYSGSKMVRMVHRTQGPSFLRGRGHEGVWFWDTSFDRSSFWTRRILRLNSFFFSHSICIFIKSDYPHEAIPGRKNHTGIHSTSRIPTSTSDPLASGKSYRHDGLWRWAFQHEYAHQAVRTAQLANTMTLNPLRSMLPLTLLVRRLEAATSRLEDIAASASDTPQSGTGPDSSKTPSINGDHGLSRSVPLAASQPGEATKEPLPPTVEAFDTLLGDELAAFSDVSEKLGDPITKQSNLFCDAFRAQRQVLLVATKAKAPEDTDSIWQELLSDLIKHVQSIQSIRDEQRKSPAENHLAMIADGSGILSWVQVKPGADKYVEEVLGGARMYGNRIMTAHKGKDTADPDWVKAFVNLCGALIAYIKEHHARGLQWNASGVTVEEALKEVRSGPTSKGSAVVPPPPPPPPPPSFDTPPAPPQPALRSPPGGDMSSVFADLNRGESVTSGLKKVDKSQMTHKNPSLRSQDAAPTLDRSDSSSSGRGKSPQPPRKPESMRQKKPSKKELEGNKWTIENFENEQTPIELEATRNQSILVSKCKGVTIKVNGKANAISLDGCSKTDMLIESLVSSVDVINSSSFRLQVMGSLPAVQLDKVDGAIIFLSKESLHTEVYTSKCSSINITLPPAGDEDDSTECPVPEQIKSTVVDGKLVNEIVKQEG